MKRWQDNILEVFPNAFCPFDPFPVQPSGLEVLIALGREYYGSNNKNLY